MLGFRDAERRVAAVAAAAETSRWRPHASGWGPTPYPCLELPGDRGCASQVVLCAFDVCHHSKQPSRGSALGLC